MKDLVKLMKSQAKASISASNHPNLLTFATVKGVERCLMGQNREEIQMIHKLLQSVKQYLLTNTN